MSRRVSLPGADELFRRTSSGAPEPEPVAHARRPQLAAAPAPAQEPDADGPGDADDRDHHRDHHRDHDAAPRPGAAAPDRAAQAVRPARPARTPSGRVRHDEKMTVYVTSDELLELEHARLVLRRTLGSAVDRGRLVRAAVAMALANLDEHGADSDLVRRLRES